MGTIWVRELTGGLDTRRMPETTPGGVLIRATDGHITRGGEFEKRPAFVSVYNLSGGTIGLSHTLTSLTVFGHELTPDLPAGIAYQQLEHPDGGIALSRVLSTDLNAGKLYVVAEFADGSIHHFYDGDVVEDWFDGRARASFQIIDGTTGSELDDLTVDGVSILTGPIAWATSHSETAEDIADAINTHVSSPEYTATFSGDRVSIVASTPGAASNGLAVLATISGGLVLSPATGIALANGADSSGTFQPGTFVRTIGSKLYSVSGPLLHFSGIKEPTKFTTDVTGAGFIDLSSEASGAEELQAVATYQGFIAVFAESVVQIWYVDPDPALNRISQVLNNTGTASPGSVTQFGDSDLFYLDQSGLRSLRARDSSNAAATTDIGVPVDSLIVERLQAMSESDRKQVFGLINPVDGRFWLCMIDTIFVFSFYVNAKVSAWTTYQPTYIDAHDDLESFEIEAVTVFNRRIYLRSGDTIFAFGGLGATPAYDNVQAEAWLPYFDAEKPTSAKDWEGVDAAVEGTWEVRAAMDPTDLTASDKIAVIDKTTFNSQRIPFAGSSSHLSLRFLSQNDAAAKLSAAVIHYKGGEEEK